jgi:hypothetical protein
MKTMYLYAFCLLAIVSGCESNENEPIPDFESPEGAQYDFDEDGINDFSIDYNTFVWDGVNSSGWGVAGLLKPLNENSILHKRDVNYVTAALFSKKNDVITADISLPLEWETYHARLADIYDPDKNVNQVWNIHSANAPDSYYLGIKIKKENGFLIGWVKLEIDKATGQISIVDKKLTTDNSILIDR